MKHRRVTKIGSLLLAAALVFSFACAPAEEVQPAPEKVIIIGTQQEFPAALNPFTENSCPYMGTRTWVYNSLYEWGLGDEPIPDLAKEIVVSPDRKTYTITIRDDATFHDGVPLTAEDVAFSYNYIIDNNLGHFTTDTDPLAEFKVIDDYTVDMTLSESTNRDWLNYNTFVHPPIIPKHIWKDTTADEAMMKPPMEKIIGSGPYQFVEFVPDDHFRLRATPEAKALGVNIDEFIIKAYGNTATMVEDLIHGDIDAIYRLDLKAVPTLEGVSGVTLEALKPHRINHVIFNCFPNAYEEGRETRPHPALKDILLRQALDWTFDEKVATEVAYGKYAVPGCPFIAPSYGDYSNTELDCRGFDLDKARQILDDAGYLDTDGDGIREDAEGRPLVFDCETPAPQPALNDVATVWARETEKVGIKLNLLTVDPDTLWAAMLPEGDFDISIWGWNGSADPTDLLVVLLSKQAVAGGLADAGFVNEEFDELYRQQRVAPSNEARKDIVWRMQELLHEELPYFVWTYRGDFCATRNDRVDIDVELLKGTGYGVMTKVFALNADTVS